MPTDKELFELHTQGATPAEIAARFGLRKDSVRGRISRHSSGIAALNEQLQAEVLELRERLDRREDKDAVFGNDLGTPWRLEGDFIIAGDVHCNTVNQGFMQRPLQIAREYLVSPRRLVLAGDIWNATGFGKYPAIYPEPSFGKELAGARAFFELYLKTFDEIYITLGNHDRRVQKATNGAIEPADLLRMVSADPRVKISWWGHSVISTSFGEFRASHGSEYSVNQLILADQMAHKYQQHMILHHEHHLAMGWDRYGNYLIINNGGLFDETSMAYVQLDDNKKPRMKNGFTLLLDGTPFLFGKPPFTNWGYWLGGKAK